MHTVPRPRSPYCDCSNRICYLNNLFRTDIDRQAFFLGRHGGCCCSSVRTGFLFLVLSNFRSQCDKLSTIFRTLSVNLENLLTYVVNRMGPVADGVVATFGDSILVELGLHTGFELTGTAANDLVLSKALKAVIPIHSKRLETTGVKVLLITLKHKQTISDAALGFYRSSLHK